MQVIRFIAIGSLSLLSNLAFAANQPWVGELYNIIPNKTHITEDYCKSHSLNTYKTTVQDQQNEVTADNGVTAKDLGSTMKKKDGIYYHTANVMFSGVTNGKPWQEKAYFSYYGLTKNSPLYGFWYTENCKGFYKSNPA